MAYHTLSELTRLSEVTHISPNSRQYACTLNRGFRAQKVENMEPKRTKLKKIRDEKCFSLGLVFMFFNFLSLRTNAAFY